MRGLKFDRQFIYDLDDPRSAEIVRMLAEYCAPRGLMIVAEGVESASQADIIRRLFADTFAPARASPAAAR